MILAWDAVEMKVGDLVTVLPHGEDLYLVIGFVREADTAEAQQELGSLWRLDGINRRDCQMHEKWIKVINENR